MTTDELTTTPPAETRAPGQPRAASGRFLPAATRTPDPEPPAVDEVAQLEAQFADLEARGLELHAATQDGGDAARAAEDAWLHDRARVAHDLSRLRSERAQALSERHRASPIARELADVEQRLAEARARDLDGLALRAIEGDQAAAGELDAREADVDQLQRRQRRLTAALTASDRRAEVAEAAAVQAARAAARAERDALTAAWKAAVPDVEAATAVLIEAMDRVMQAATAADDVERELPAGERRGEGGRALFRLEELLITLRGRGGFARLMADVPAGWAVPSPSVGASIPVPLTPDELTVIDAYATHGAGPTGRVAPQSWPLHQTPTDRANPNAAALAAMDEGLRRYVEQTTPRRR